MIQLLLLLPLLLFAPYLGSYLYFPGSVYSDLAISHYPNAVFLTRALQTWGQVPLWSPSILSGYPFAANPLSGLWYPPGWLAFLTPSPIGFNVTILLHLLWGGLGMYRLLKSMQLHPTASIIGAISFEAMPKLIGHFAAGHISLIYAVCWTPWILYLERRYRLRNDRKKFMVLPGVILGIIALADVRWVLFAGLLWMGYAIAIAWEQNKGNYGGEIHHSGHPFRRLTLRNWAIFGGYIFSQVVLGGLIMAPMLIPLLEYTRLSSRMAMLPGDVFTLSLPPLKLLGLIYPDTAGTPEWVIYPPGIILGLALFATFARRIRARCRFWVGVAVTSVLFALGSNLPFLSLIGNLPGFSLLRVPPRIMFIFGMSLATLASFAVDALSVEFADRRFMSHIRPEMPLILVAFFAMAFTVGLSVIHIAISPLILLGVGGLGAATVWIILRQNKKTSTNIWGSGTLILCLLNLGSADRMLIDPRPEMTSSAEARSTAQYLGSQPGAYRIYSPSYSLPQQLAADYHLQLADGVDPLQLQAYRDYMLVATGIPSPGYSVTLPSFIHGDPTRDTQGYMPELTKLGMLNVRYIVSAYELNLQGLTLRYQSGATRVYENNDAYPRAWVQADEKPHPLEEIQPAVLDSWEPNQIEVTARGPGLLVLSEMAYPGWQMWVDGRPVQMITVDGIFRGVWIGPGEHRVVNRFIPHSIDLGLILGVTGCVIAMILTYLLKGKNA